jgi:hypothetical protein
MTLVRAITMAMRMIQSSMGRRCSDNATVAERPSSAPACNRSTIMPNHLAIWKIVARAQRELAQAIKQKRTIRSVAATFKIHNDTAIEQPTHLIAQSREFLNKPPEE